MARADVQLSDRWERHAEEWRHPAQVVGGSADAAAVDPGILRYAARGAWWETLAGLGITLLVSREYEHLVVALGAPDGRPAVSFLPMPHPSGIAVDRATGTVHVASTRNPNQLFDLVPITESLERADGWRSRPSGTTLVPIRSRFYPGALYIHDLAFIGGELHANSVGQNAVVRLPAAGGMKRVWWPRAVETDAGPRFEANHLQLNSIAAGPDLAGSYFTASTATIGRYRPGHPDFPVDRRGVVFSGRTGEVVAGGLTRPHSARFHEGVVWVDNSGYGEVGPIVDGTFQPAWKLPGWTRGLCLVGHVAFVGTSRVIRRFRQYAPGLDVDRSVCAIHALDVRSGSTLGSLRWPAGNQLFAIDWLPGEMAGGLPFRRAGAGPTSAEKHLFYTFCPPPSGRGHHERDQDD